MSGFSDYTTLLPRKEDGGGSGSLRFPLKEQQPFFIPSSLYYLEA